MDPKGTVGWQQDVKKERSSSITHAPEVREAAAAAVVPPPPAAQPPRVVANGIPDHRLNGVLPNGTTNTEHPSPTADSAVSAAGMDHGGGDGQRAPPLDQSWRQHDSNKSLGRMIERLAQKCYKDLNVTLRQMRDIENEARPHQPNGTMPHAGEDTSESSLRKKRLLMEFAKDQRDAFIKTLVLTDWSRNEKDQGKLIDVKVWQDKQREAQFSATRAVGQTKVNMIPAKVPAPNIEGAMDLLATGKASSALDAIYIPPKRLTPKQLLKTLRNMNVVLATRLSLHEALPPHFADYTIADGRARFTVQDEFEVDLSVADEDPATPFYFIDIRLLFTPTPSILNDRLRGFLEAKVNNELATKGLKGCYDFLHNFVITHKINILRGQAMELIRGKWFDCVRPENMRRSFIVQYWVGMPGPKSWIEIGISSGNKASPKLKRNAGPQISVRWFRRGVELANETFDFNWRDLNLEKCLNVVIHRHIDWVLQDLQRRIQSLTGPESPTTTELKHLETTEPSVLLLSQPALKEPLEIRIEPITGQFSITPPSQHAAKVERQLNTNALIDPAKYLTSLICAIAQARLHKEVEILGWTPTSNLIRQDDLQRLFGEPTRHLSVYSPSRAWGDGWALAITFSLSGEKFWTVSLEDRRDEQGTAIGKTITRVRAVSQPFTTSQNGPTSRMDLIRIGKLAVAEVAFSALDKRLTEMRIPHTFEKLTSSSLSEGTTSTDPTAAPAPAMFIRFSSLIKPVDAKKSKPWAADLVRLTHYGITADLDGSSAVRHDLRLTLESGRMSNLQQHLTQNEERDVAMNSSGGLALRLLTPFGQSFVEQMQQRLRRIERLDRWVTVLKKRGFRCSRVSLSQLAFTYSESPALEAQLSFSGDDSRLIRLKLAPPAANPHQRIRVMLEQGLNNTSEEQFGTFADLLRFTLPALQALEQLEAVSPATQSLIVHVRDPSWYSLKYKAPFPACAFQLRVRTRVEGTKRAARWHTEPTHDKTTVPEDFTKALGELWESRGEHWQGLRTGAVADISGIGTLLEKVDEVVRRFEGSATAPTAAAATASDPVKLPKEEAPSQPQVKNQPQPSAAVHIKTEPDVIMLD